jgi:DNA-binding transcriptional LysR family regulator
MFLNINQLRSFYNAAKFKSITSAAQRLMVTPSAVCIQIKNLEETLELKLTYREGNSIRLTQIGSEIFKRSEKIFGQIMDMEDFVEELSRARTGLLRLGCAQTPAKYIMPRLLPIFKKEYPGIKIVLDQGTTAEMIEGVLNKKIEIAMVGQYMPGNNKLKFKTRGNHEVMLVAAPSSRHPITDEISVTQIPNLPLILPREGSATRQVVLKYFQSFNVTPNIILEAVSLDIIKELVKQGDGVSFIIDYAVREELQAKTLKSIRILEGQPTMELRIIYVERKFLSPAAWAFLRLLDKLGGITAAMP